MEFKTKRARGFPRPFPEKDVLFQFQRLDEQGVSPLVTVYFEVIFVFIVYTDLLPKKGRTRL